MTDATNNITIGLEACIAQRPAMLDGARFGLLMNRASVDRNLRLACDALDEAYPGQLVSLFTPQHGLWGDVQANMIESPHGRHPQLDVPIYSLYSETRRPTDGMLADLECLVVDLQDVGTRVYTFAWTLQQCLAVCAAADVGVLVLDRANPLGGEILEGPLLDLAFRSFVGGASIPMRHGLTIGELARLLNEQPDCGARLETIPLQDWSPTVMFPQLGRHWIPPSPNLPSFASALVYAGQVLLEGTNLSEGRGTTTPFEVVGAPYVDADVLSDALQSWQLPGIRFLPIHFRPTFDKWQGLPCQGVSLHVTDAAAFRPYRTTVAVIAAVRRHWPDEFAWRSPPYEYETSKPPIDILSGSAGLRTALDGAPVIDAAQLDALSNTEGSWRERAGRALLYERR